MKVTVNTPLVIDLVPGAKVVINIDDESRIEIAKIERVVQINNRIHVMLSDGTCRPITTYGKSWQLA